MTLNNAALTTGANAIEAEVTHLQAHSAAPDAGFTTNAVGTRAAATGSVDGDGDITWTANFTGLPASGPITHISYWTAATGGSNRGGGAVGSGDTSANAAGEFTATVVENGTAS